MSTIEKSYSPIETYLKQAETADWFKSVRESRLATTSKGMVGELLKEINRFGVITGVILICGCLAGVAVGVGALASEAQLIMLVVPMMFTLSMLLAVQPMKWIVGSAAVAILVDIALILFNVL